MKRVMSLILIAMILATTGCGRTSPSSDVKVLNSKHGHKNIYLWSRTKTDSDGHTRSCWYYKETTPAQGLSLREAMTQSIPLNVDGPIHKARVEERLARNIREKLTNFGFQISLCGATALSGIGTVASVLGGPFSWASTGSAGALTIFLGHNCLRGTPKAYRELNSYLGGRGGRAHIGAGNTDVGPLIEASKFETDMIRDAVKELVELGVEAPGGCQRPVEFLNDANFSSQELIFPWQKAREQAARRGQVYCNGEYRNQPRPGEVCMTP